MASDPGIKDYLAFMKQYLPGAEPNDSNAVYGYGQSMTFFKVLSQCGDDLSRENVMKQAKNLVDYELPVALPGIKINTSPTHLHPFSQVQLARFDGTSFVPLRKRSQRRLRRAVLPAIAVVRSLAR